MSERKKRVRERDENEKIFTYCDDVVCRLIISWFSSSFHSPFFFFSCTAKTIPYGGESYVISYCIILVVVISSSSPSSSSSQINRSHNHGIEEKIYKYVGKELLGSSVLFLAFQFFYWQVQSIMRSTTTSLICFVFFLAAFKSSFFVRSSLILLLLLLVLI